MKLFRRYFFIPLLLAFLSLQPLFLAGCELKPGCKPGGPSTPDIDPCAVNFVQANIKIWYVFENPAIMQKLATDYENLHPGITITPIQKESWNQYDKDLGIVSGGPDAPDIYFIRHDMLPIYYKKLVPMPKNVLMQGADTPSNPPDYNQSLDEYVSLFTPALKTDMVRSIAETSPLATNCDGSTRTEALYGVPLSFGGEALLINMDLINEHNQAKPSQQIDYLVSDMEHVLSWDELSRAARSVIKTYDTWLSAPPEGTSTGRWYNEDDISVYGVALGNSVNVDLSYDIFTTLMIQYGADIVSSDHQEVLFNEGAIATASNNALSRYTGFEMYWDDTWSPSIQSFQEGRVAMAFARHYQMINVQSSVPRMQTFFFPQQFPDDESQWVTPAYYWSQVVGRNPDFPQNADIAWDFLKFAASKEQMLAYSESYLSAPARIDLIGEVQLDDLYDPYIESVRYAQSFYKGNPEDTNSAVKEAISTALSSRDPQRALDILAEQIQQIIKEYE